MESEFRNDAEMERKPNFRRRCNSL